jgi:hypothetical protein
VEARSAHASGASSFTVRKIRKSARSMSSSMTIAVCEPNLHGDKKVAQAMNVAQGCR